MHEVDALYPQWLSIITSLGTQGMVLRMSDVRDLWLPCTRRMPLVSLCMRAPLLDSRIGRAVGALPRDLLRRSHCVLRLLLLLVMVLVLLVLLLPRTTLRRRARRPLRCSPAHS
jgi:hypothetical protein